MINSLINLVTSYYLIIYFYVTLCNFYARLTDSYKLNEDYLNEEKRRASSNRCVRQLVDDDNFSRRQSC